jgi:hypothetical protein
VNGCQMTKGFSVLGCVLILHISWLAIVQPQPTKSVVLRDCDNIKDCGADSNMFPNRPPPDSTSLIVVYLYDVTGMPVANQTVMAMREDGSAGPRAAATARTDIAGMAAINVAPGGSYTVQIADVGWAPLATAAKVAANGGVRLLRVLMKVPPIA